LIRRSKDDRGQVLSSLVAVLAVVAIVGGLLVLFGTRGNSIAADASKPAATTPKPSVKPTTAPSTAPSSAPTIAPSSEPTSAPTTAQTTQPTTDVPTIPASERPAVEVYNNTARKGLADDVSNRARQAGWTVAGRDNWHGKIVTSTVYFPAGMQAEAAQLAKDIGVNRIKDALDNMKKDRLTVILTTDYAG
jgi:pyruvate/2-oxoglutarate dehydrogenase complex dihydrolipoamide acyltransferase (E2) component